jgi:hypothetical protein
MKEFICRVSARLSNGRAAAFDEGYWRSSNMLNTSAATWQTQTVSIAKGSVPACLLVRQRHRDPRELRRRRSSAFQSAGRVERNLQPIFLSYGIESFL